MRDMVILSMLGGSNSARSGSVSWAWRERVMDARSDSGSRYMEGKGHRCDLCVLGGTGSCIGAWRGRILKMIKKTLIGSEVCKAKQCFGSAWLQYGSESSTLPLDPDPGGQTSADPCGS